LKSRLEGFAILLMQLIGIFGSRECHHIGVACPLPPCKKQVRTNASVILAHLGKAQVSLLRLAYPLA
jgi:hypothetical protein